MIKKAIVYTDGACSGNPGPGGWGATIKIDRETFEIYGGEDDTTNNSYEITLYTDSNYVKDGITKWIFNWKKNNWKTSSKKTVKNSDLWIQLDAIQEKRKVNWNWVKGHSGNIGNERADELARMGIEEI